MVGLWSYHLLERTKEINLQSVATAKMALLLEIGLSSFGGGGNKVVQDIKRYLPFAVTSNEGELDRETIEIFWELNNDGKIPNYFQSALIKESLLMEELKNGRI
jgi:hypothetical protein